MKICNEGHSAVVVYENNACPLCALLTFVNKAPNPAELIVIKEPTLETIEGEDISLEDTISVEKYEFELGRSFELGIGAGLEQAGRTVSEKATNFFKANNDEMAKALRNLAFELTKEGKTLAEKARQKKSDVPSE